MKYHTVEKMFEKNEEEVRLFAKETKDTSGYSVVLHRYDKGKVFKKTMAMYIQDDDVERIKNENPKLKSLINYLDSSLE